MTDDLGLSDASDWKADRFRRGIEKLPEFTLEQYMAFAEVIGVWFRIKAESEPRLTVEQRQMLNQLDPDIWHSALLQRMLVQRKPPLPEPPPLDHAYPVYPEDS